MPRIFLPAAITLLALGSFHRAAIAQITGQPSLPQSTPAQTRPAQPNLPTQSTPPGSSANGQPSGLSPTLSPISASSANYILGAGDQVALSVIGYPEFTGTVAILADGSITLPLVGQMQAAGLTSSQFSNVLTQNLKTYLVDPVVSISLTTMRPVIVTVSGEVHRPGPVQLTGLSSSDAEPLSATPGTEGQVSNSAPSLNKPSLPTLSSAILRAGGVTRDADIRQVIVRRPAGSGRTEVLTLNLWEAITSNAGIADLGLRDGDAIYIPQLTGDEIDRRTIASSSLAPETVRVKVVGEVKNPGEVAVAPDSTVSSAVAIAGGPTNDAQLNSVSLVRQNESGEIEETEINLENLVDDYQIRDGDVVVVEKRGYLSVTDGIARVLNPLNIFRLLGF